jgi:hypothetical protein
MPLFRQERPIHQERILSAAFAIVLLSCSLISAILAAFYLDASFGVVTEGEVIGHTTCCAEEGGCEECLSIRFRDVGGQWQTVNLDVEDIPRRVKVRYLPAIQWIGGTAIAVEERVSPATGIAMGVLALIALGLALVVIIRYVFIARQYRAKSQADSN